MDLSGIEEAVTIAQARWPGYEFRIKAQDEAAGPCPIEGEGEDRFILWENGHWWCRRCNASGWLDDDRPQQWTPEQKAARRIEAELMRQKRKQAEFEQRLSALEKMSRCTDHLAYHQNLDEASYTWWMEQGMEPYTIIDRKLGYCPRCPTDRERRDSYTLPIYDYHGSVLWNIRHRLNGQTADKYRPHISGLGAQLANTQSLQDADYAIILEGAKKAVCVSQYDFPAVGVMGKSGTFKIDWLRWFPTGPIYIALDPDAHENADRLGKGIANLNREVRIAQFPMKPDDLFIAGGTADDFNYYLRMARKVH